MKKLFILLSFFAVFIGPVCAEGSPVKLTGNIIGTTEGYDYSTGKTSTTVNTAKAVFDGDLSTFMAAAVRSGGWAGMDLGGTHKITKISYCPYISHPERLVNGIFQGANRPDFMDATTIFKIVQQPSTKIMTTQSVENSKVFRYIRYIGPNDSRSNIAEVEFYGYKAVGDSSANISMPQLTNLPTIYIYTENGEAITSKDYYLPGKVFIATENGDSVFMDSIDIKGRGNNSWGYPKKPYRMKLHHKANLLDMPAKAKDWTLINAFGDKTLMRNLLAFDLSKRLEMKYTPAGKPVDVVLNDDYVGTYLLCDQLEVNPGRVEVEKMKETDTPEESLTGGYLIEMDAYAGGEAVNFSSDGGVPVTVKYPDDDEITSEQKEYIRTHFNLMESTLFSKPTEALNNYIDTTTFLRQFLVGEFSGNTDTYWSTYMYKYRNNDKFYFGPVWDFDLAYDNDNRTYPINEKTDWVYTFGSSASGVRSLVDKILQNTVTYNKLKKIWARYRDSGILSEYALLKVVDDYAAELDKSQQLNFVRWPIMNDWVHQNPYIWGSYEAEVGNVKRYISERIDWIDNKLSYTPGKVNLNSSATSDIHLWTESNTMYIAGLSDRANVEVYDLTGRMVLSTNASTSLSVNMNSGSYLVRINDTLAGRVVLKCMIP